MRRRSNRACRASLSALLPWCLLLGLLGAPPAMAAANWQWTRGEGWSEGAGRARETPTAQLAYAGKLEKQGDYADAAKQFFLLIRTYPDSREAGVALQHLSLCLFKMENYLKAYEAMEQVIKSYPHSGRLLDLLTIEHKIAKKMMTRGLPSILDEEQDRMEKGRRAAVRVLTSVVKHDPYGPRAPAALLALGDCHLLLQEPQKAAKQYSRLLKEFPQSKLAERAQLGETRAKVMFGKATAEEVDQMIKRVRTREPTEAGSADEEAALAESLRDLEEMEAKKMWAAYEHYYQRGTSASRQAAAFTLKELIRRYPQTAHARRARGEVGRVDIPRAKARRFRKVRLNLNPFAAKNEKPAFITPQLDSHKRVKSMPVLEPVPGVDDDAGESVASAALNRPPATDNSRPALPPVSADNRTPTDHPVLPPKRVAAPELEPSRPARTGAGNTHGAWEVDLGEKKDSAAPRREKPRITPPAEDDGPPAIPIRRRPARSVLKKRPGVVELSPSKPKVTTPNVGKKTNRWKLSNEF